MIFIGTRRLAEPSIKASRQGSYRPVCPGRDLAFEQEGTGVFLLRTYATQFAYCHCGLLA